MNTTTSYAAMSISSGIMINAITACLALCPWAAIFIFTRMIGISLYHISDKETCLRIQKRVKHASQISENGKALGYGIGRWFLCHIGRECGEGIDRYTVTLLATSTSHTRLTQDEFTVDVSQSSDCPNKPKRAMQIYERIGSYQNHYYKKRTVAVHTLKPRDSQETIMKAIRDHYDTHEHAVAFIYGPPGTGKSMIGMLLADHYQSAYCNTFAPWEPGVQLGELYGEVEPTEEKPLIVAFDEVDGVLISIHQGAILGHKNLPTVTANKSGWNRFLDEIGRGMYPYLILIMTSNRSADFVRGLDSSYIRPGRVDIVMELIE